MLQLHIVTANCACVVLLAHLLHTPPAVVEATQELTVVPPARLLRCAEGLVGRRALDAANTFAGRLPAPAP